MVKKGEPVGMLLEAVQCWADFLCTRSVERVQLAVKPWLKKQGNKHTMKGGSESRKTTVLSLLVGLVGGGINAAEGGREGVDITTSSQPLPAQPPCATPAAAHAARRPAAGAAPARLPAACL